MNRRKRGIFLIITACLLLAGICFLLYRVFSPKDGDNVTLSADAACVRNIPADACAVLLFGDFEDAVSVVGGGSSVFAEIFPAGDSLPGFVSKLCSLSDLGGAYAGLSGTDASFSFHSPYQGSLAVLLSLTLPRNLSSEKVISSLRSAYPDTETFSYDSVTVYHSASSPVYFAAVGSGLVASESQVLIQSAVRHSVSGISIADNEGFKEAAESVGAPSAFFFHNADADRFFSAVLDAESRRAVSMAGDMAEWTAVGVSFTDYGFSFSGLLTGDGDKKGYAEAVRRQEPAVTGVFGVLPYYTFAVASLKLSDRHSYLKSYYSFLEANRRATAYDRAASDSLADFLNRQDVSEIAVAGIQVSGKTQWINLFRTDRALSHSPRDWNWLGSRYLPFMAGDGADQITLLPGWVITGPGAAIDEYVSNRALYISLDEYLSRNDVTAETSRKSVLGVYLNFDAQGPRAYRMFRQPLAGGLKSAFDSTSFEMLSCDFSKDASGAPVVSGDFDALFAPEILNDQVRDTVRQTREGPAKLVNPKTGEVNYLIQLPNRFIRYSDASGKGLWAAPLDSAIVGDVTLVDLYGDGNYVMLFAAGEKYYLLDRTARYVGRTPKSLGKKIAAGPSLFGLEGGAKQAFMVLFADNTLGLYTLDGDKYEGWKGIESRETITKLPTLISVEGKDYWVLRTAVQTVICRADGSRAALFEKNSRLKPKSEVTPAGGSVVKVDCYDGKKYLLDLSDGSFKKCKKQG